MNSKPYSPLFWLQPLCQRSSTMLKGDGRKNQTKRHWKFYFRRRLDFFSYAAHILIELRFKRGSTIPVSYGREIRFAFLLRGIINVWTAVYEHENIGSITKTLVLYLFRNRKLGRFVFIAIQVNEHFLLELQCSLATFFEPKANKLSHPLPD